MKMNTTDDRTLDVVTVALTYLSTLISILSVPFTIVILYVISREHSPSLFRNAFFTFCKVGLVIDILALLNIKLLMTIPSLGWFVPLYTANDYPKRIFYFLNWTLRTMQGFSNTYICVNRATAVLFPLLHLKMWGSPAFLRVLLIAQMVISCISGFESAKYDSVWNILPSGRAFAVKVDNRELRAHWRRGFNLIVLSCGIMSILYPIMVVRFRSEMNAFKQQSTQAKSTYLSPKRTYDHSHSSSLLAISGVVVSLEVMYCLFFYRSYVALRIFEDDNRIYFTKYFLITDIYSLILTYSLLIFSGPVRKELRKFFWPDKSEIVAMNDTTNLSRV